MEYWGFHNRGGGGGGLVHVYMGACLGPSEAAGSMEVSAMGGSSVYSLKIFLLPIDRQISRIGVWNDITYIASVLTSSRRAVF